MKKLNLIKPWRLRTQAQRLSFATSPRFDACHTTPTLQQQCAGPQDADAHTTAERFFDGRCGMMTAALAVSFQNAAAPAPRVIFAAEDINVRF